MDALFRTALRLCQGQAADAEDLLQESMLKAFTSYGQLRDASAVRPWLFTILTRTHLNRSRTARRRPEVVGTDLDEAAFEAALAEWTPMRAPDEEMELHHLREHLTQAIDELPAELRRVIWFVDVEGFTQREVAHIEEVPEGTIASRLFRARRRLRAVLEVPARDARVGRHP